MAPARRHRVRVDPSKARTSRRSIARTRTILATLAWAGVLSTAHIERLEFPSRRRAQKGMRSLFDDGLVRVCLHGEAWHRDNLYTITAAGLRLLEVEGLLPGEPPRPPPAPRATKLPHTLLLRDVFVALLLAEREGHLRVDDFLFDRDLAREPLLRDVGLIPDGLAVLDCPGGERRVGVEVDRGTETLATLRAKFQRWRTLLDAAPAILPRGSALLIVVTRAGRRATLSRAVTETLLAPRARVVLVEELPALFASGWPHEMSFRTGGPAVSAQTDEASFEAVRTS